MNLIAKCAGALLILLCLTAPDAAAQTKILRFGTLWDGSRVLNDAVVVVEGDRITRVMSGAELTPGGEVIDLRRYTALPGLIDLHTHMTFYRYYVDARDEFGFKLEAIAPLQAYIERNLDLRRRAVKAGVRLGMGSDAVYTMFGQNTRELGWLVRAGLTPAQALAAATTTAAELLGLQDRLGRIAPGYLADVVAVEADPLQRIDALFTGVRWVMKDGKVVVDKR